MNTHLRIKKLRGKNILFNYYFQVQNRMVNFEFRFAFMQASVPVGVMGGYIIAAIVLHQQQKYPLGILNWRIPILIEVLLLVPICFAFFCIPRGRFDLNLSRSYNTPTMSTNDTDETATDSNISRTWRSVVSIELQESEEDVEDESEPGISHNVSQYFSELKEALLYLYHLPMYKYLVCTLTALYFVVTGVQYWVPSYMLVCTESSISLVNILFIIVVSTSPTSGVIWGGWIVDRRGGYRSNEQRIRSLKLCFCFGCISVAAAISIIFVNNVWQFSILLWIILFFGAAVLPPCSGIIVSIVPNKYRAISSSINLIIYNFFGYFLSLSLSGLLMQLLLVYRPRCNYNCAREYGFRTVMLWSIFSLLFLYFAIENSTRACSNWMRRQCLLLGCHHPCCNDIEIVHNKTNSLTFSPMLISPSKR